MTRRFEVDAHSVRGRGFLSNLTGLWSLVDTNGDEIMTCSVDKPLSEIHDSIFIVDKKRHKFIHYIYTKDVENMKLSSSDACHTP